MNDPANTGAARTATALPKRVNDLRGQTFGLLAVLEYAGRAENSGHALWRCVCSCVDKTIKDVPGYLLVNGGVKSCGCLRVETGKKNATHGMTGTPEYDAWRGLKKRTQNPNHEAYPDYGGRGISVCERWLESFENFFEDMGPKKDPKHTLERVDNALGYCKSNCVWATVKSQNRNRRSNRTFMFEGKLVVMAELTERFGFSYKLIAGRIRKGMTIEEACYTPVRAYKKTPPG